VLFGKSFDIIEKDNNKNRALLEISYASNIRKHGLGHLNISGRKE